MDKSQDSGDKVLNVRTSGRKVQLKDKDGNEAYPRTKMDMVDGETDSDEFSVTDKDGNVIFSIKADGISAAIFHILDKDGNEVITYGKDTLERILSQSGEFYIADKDGNVLFKVDQEGVSLGRLLSLDGRGNIIFSVKHSPDSNFYIADKDGNILFKISSNGLNVKSINFLDSSGCTVRILSPADINDIYTKINNINSRIDDLPSSGGETSSDTIEGNTYGLQEKKGTYYYPIAIETPTGVLKVNKEYNNIRFRHHSLKFYTENVEPTGTADNDNVPRGTCVLDYGKDVTIKESLSVWIKVPTLYTIDDKSSVKHQRSFAVLSFKLKKDDTIVGEFNYTRWSMTSGWKLFKITQDDFIGKTFNKIEVGVNTTSGQPNITIFIDAIVIDQRSIPVLCFSMDSDIGSMTIESGFARYIVENHIPVELGVTRGTTYPSSYNQSMTGNEISAFLYNSGQADDGLYTGTTKGKENTFDMLEDLDAGGEMLNEKYKAGFAVRPIICIRCSHNWASDELVTAAKIKGFKIFRATSLTPWECYCDDESCVINCTSFGCPPTKDKLTEDFIQAQIQKGKGYIDMVIKYGLIGSFMTHEVINISQFKDSDINLNHIRDVVEGVLDYALQKQYEGKLRLMTLDNLYYRSTNK